jgi:hypothetical protein
MCRLQRCVRKISLVEVLIGLKKLQNDRAGGPQGLPAELLLRYAKLEDENGKTPAVHVLAPVLVSVLNCAFEAGRVLASVNGSLINPVSKHGDSLQPRNHGPNQLL